MKKLYLSVCMVFLCVLHSFGQVPVLNSYPSAPAVILLDFDGHHVAGTSWNWNGPFSCGPANLNTAQIEEVFARVAEDYRPFNLNITNDTARYWAAPYNRRARVVLTVTNEWYGSGAGGVASTGSFARGDNTPAFVFTKLLNYNTKDVAEAASHEAGHTLGLRHQAVYDSTCVKLSDYNRGTGWGEASWAPIMGAGYGRNVTTWHIGTSSRSCSNIQNDLEVITSATNGVTFRTDDHANAPLTASAAKVSGDALVAEGLIEQPTDLDYFTLTVPKTSTFHLEAKPYSVGAGNSGANLNVNVSLVNEAQKEVANFSSASQLSKTIDTVLSAGKYYLRVDGAGGEYFSDYGSLGKYSLQGSLSPMSTLPLRQLTLQGSTNGGAHLLRWVVDADEAIVRQVLEASANGSSFEALREVGTDARQWQQAPLAGALVQYRLRVLFSNGQEHLSNTVALRGAAQNTARPRLAGTLITGSAINITSPVVCQYHVTDMSGKLLLQGTVGAGNTTVQAPALAPGMYLLKFSWGGEWNVEKLLKK